MADEKPVSRSDIKWILTIIVPLLAIAVSWGVMTAKIDAMDCRISENTVKITENQKNQTDILVRLARIESDVLWIRQQIEKGN